MYLCEVFVELYVFELWHSVKDDQVLFSARLKGSTRTPNFTCMIKELVAAHANVRQIDEIFDWSAGATALYDELSRFSHTRGAFHTYSALRNINVTAFSEQATELVTDMIIRVIRFVGMGFAMRFPMAFHGLPLFEKFAFSEPCGGYLDFGQADNVIKMFPSSDSGRLLEICLADAEANSQADSIKQMPDLTTEQVMSSLLDSLGEEDFEPVREQILSLLSENKFDQACAMMLSIQRATARAILAAAFNPFRVQGSELLKPSRFGFLDPARWPLP